MSKPCHFSFKIRMKQVFTINKPNIMKKPKYQQYCHFFIDCILIPHASWFSYEWNMITVLMNAAFLGATLIRGEALIRGKRLFQCGYPKMSSLLEGALIWGPVLIRGNTVCFAMIDRIVTKRTEWSAFCFKVDEI